MWLITPPLIIFWTGGLYPAHREESPGGFCDYWFLDSISDQLKQCLDFDSVTICPDTAHGQPRLRTTILSPISSAMSPVFDTWVRRWFSMDLSHFCMSRSYQMRRIEIIRGFRFPPTALFRCHQAPFVENGAQGTGTNMDIAVNH